MRPRDWFSVGLRLFGVWLFYRSLGDVLAAASWFLGLAPRYIAKDFDDVGKGMLFNLMYAISYFAMASYLVFGSEHLTRWAFGEPSPEESLDEETASDSE